MEFDDVSRRIFSRLVDDLAIEGLEGAVDAYIDVPLFAGSHANGRTLGLDSIDALEVAIAIKGEFGVTLPNGALKEIKTIRELSTYVITESEE